MQISAQDVCEAAFGKEDGGFLDCPTIGGDTADEFASFLDLLIVVIDKANAAFAISERSEFGLAAEELLDYLSAH